MNVLLAIAFGAFMSGIKSILPINLTTARQGNTNGCILEMGSLPASHCALVGSNFRFLRGIRCICHNGNYRYLRSGNYGLFHAGSSYGYLRRALDDTRHWQNQTANMKVEQKSKMQCWAT
jgi:hypothetical protein